MSKVTGIVAVLFCGYSRLTTPSTTNVQFQNKIALKRFKWSLSKCSLVVLISGLIYLAEGKVQ